MKHPKMAIFVNRLLRSKLNMGWIGGELDPQGADKPLESYAPSLVGSYNFWELVLVAYL